MEFFTPLYELFAIVSPSPHSIAKRCCFGSTVGVKKGLSWKCLNPQECEYSGSSHKQLTGPSEAAGVIRQVAGQGYYKKSHFPWRAEFLVFHGDWGSPTDPERKDTHKKKLRVRLPSVISCAARFPVHLLISHWLMTDIKENCPGKLNFRFVSCSVTHTGCMMHHYSQKRFPIITITKNCNIPLRLFKLEQKNRFVNYDA